jgi:hypothetical protein
MLITLGFYSFSDPWVKSLFLLTSPCFPAPAHPAGASTSRGIQHRMATHIHLHPTISSNLETGSSCPATLCWGRFAHVPSRPVRSARFPDTVPRTHFGEHSPPLEGSYILLYPFGSLWTGKLDGLRPIRGPARKMPR